MAQVFEPDANRTEAMTARYFAPIFLSIWAAICVVLIAANAQIAQAIEAGISDYVTKPIMQDVIYVEPRFSNHIHLEPGAYFKSLHADGLLGSLEEIAQTAKVKRVEPHTRIVDGEAVPGLFVFLETDSADAIAAPKTATTFMPDSLVLAAG
ncbi:MAG: hypothetical protein AAFZ49_08760 [Cyanobacteria bacterium J06659_2]